MRVILADHHSLARGTLKTMLLEIPEIEVVSEAADMENLLTQVIRFLPDLVLIDSELPGGFMRDLILDLHTCVPRPIVLVVSTEPQNGRRILNAGADGFLSTDNQPEWLLETLQKYERRIRKI